MVTDNQGTPTPEPRPPVEPPTSGEIGPVETGKTCDSSSWRFKADPADCTSYFECVAGTVAKKRCPSGLHWSSISNICDWPQYANCASTQPTEPSTTTTPSTTTQQCDQSHLPQLKLQQLLIDKL